MYDETEKAFDAVDNTDAAMELMTAAMEEITESRASNGGKIAQAGDVKGIMPGGCVIIPGERGKLDHGGRSPLPSDDIKVSERIINGKDNGDRCPLPKEILTPVQKPADMTKLVDGVVKELATGKIGKDTVNALSYMDRDQLDKLVVKINEQLKKQGLKLNIDDLYMIVCGDPKTQGHYFQGRHATLTDIKTGKFVSGAKIPTMEDFRNPSSGTRELPSISPIPNRIENQSGSPSDVRTPGSNRPEPIRVPSSENVPPEVPPPTRPSEQENGSSRPSTLAELLRRLQSEAPTNRKK